MKAQVSGHLSGACHLDATRQGPAAARPRARLAAVPLSAVVSLGAATWAATSTSVAARGWRVTGVDPLAVGTELRLARIGRENAATKALRLLVSGRVMVRRV